MSTLFIAPFVLAALISGGLTYYVKNLAIKHKLTDMPSPRKVHTKPVPRLGGVAIVVTFLIVTLGYALITHRLEFSPFKIWFIDKRLYGVILGILVLLSIGIIDDIKGLAPWKKLIGHFIAAIIVVAYGISINYIRLPGNHILTLDTINIPLNLLNLHFNITLWGDIVTILWIVILINTINFLDGLDGLAAGISTIAAISIYFLSISLVQPAVALLAMIFAGSVFGFLPWNFNPAKIFMGDSGSMFLGFILATLAIYSGGKVATAFLVLGFPILDAVWAIFRRLISGKSPFKGDLGHFHHRLIEIGLSERKAMLVIYFVSLVFGGIAVFIGSGQKLVAIIIMAILMILIGFVMAKRLDIKR